MEEKQQKEDKQLKMEQLAREVLSLSRSTLLVNLRFLDLALSRLETVPAEGTTMHTDAQHIYYSPMHVLRSYKAAKEIPVRDYLHVVLHCVFRHMFADPGLDHALWNLACDIAVENIITDLHLKALATEREKEQASFLQAMKQSLPLITAEKVYAWLQSSGHGNAVIDGLQVCSSEKSAIDGLQSCSSEKSAIDGLQNSNLNKSFSDTLQSSCSDRSAIDVLQRLFLADDHRRWFPAQAGAETPPAEEEDENASDDGPATDGEDTEEVPDPDAPMGTMEGLAEEWKEIAEKLQTDLNTFSKDQGDRAGAMMQNLRAVNRMKTDYAAFLRKFTSLGEVMKINDDEFDYIYYTYGLQLYENMPLVEPLEYKEVRRIKDFVIAIDTSGSTSGDLVQKFVEKTYNILKSTETFFAKINLHILQCDTQIQEHVKITCQEEFDAYLAHMAIHGQGGTDFRPVFETVDRMVREKEFENLRGLIYFTDGYGTFPAGKPAYETAFVFLADTYEIPMVPPWAIRLLLQKDEIQENRL